MDLKNLEPEIRRVSRKPSNEKMFPADLSKVTVLHLRNKTITSPSPIAWLTRTRAIEIKDGQIADFKTFGKELSGLPLLDRLKLENCQILDPAPLADLMRVSILSLRDNQITDLTPLAGLEYLKLLDLRDNPNLAQTETDKLQKVLPKCNIQHNATK